MSNNQVKPANPLLRIMSLLKTGPRSLGLRFFDQYTRFRTGHPVWHLSKITPQLYVGGQQRSHGWDEVLREGITAVVNMRESWHDDLKKGVASDNYLHLKTIDNTPPKLEDLYEGVEFIRNEIEKGGKVYVHCGVGVGRAPTMAGAYLVSTGMTTDEALAMMRKVRPFVHPTRRQMKRLREFEANWNSNHAKTQEETETQ